MEVKLYAFVNLAAGDEGQIHISASLTLGK